MNCRLRFPLLRLLGLLCVLVTLVSARAQPASLQLDDSRGEADAWPAITLLSDPGGSWLVEDAQQHQGELRAPEGARSNLGVRRDAVWLRLPLQVSLGGRGRWLLDIDYPSLDRVEVYQFTEGRMLQFTRVGDDLPFRLRPLQVRTHAVALELQPGLRHELWLRVQTTSSMVLPISLVTAERYHQREAGAQLLQGVIVGIGLCLLIYSVAQWLSLRDATFAYYAVSVGGMTLFFLGYFGLGPQHLWSNSAWLTAKGPPLAGLVAMVGALLFLDRALFVAQHHPRWSRAMRIAAAVAAVAAAAFAAGVIDYRVAHLAATVLGPLPIVLGLGAALARLRAGDRAALYVVIGWGLYGAGFVVLALLLRGWIDATWWTQHAFEFGMLVEMVMWQRALAVRQQQQRHAAEQADREREALRSLAHTDALTGLPNRRGLQLELDRALPRAVSERPLGVFLLDLDGFKAVNDRHGHDAGDELLKSVADRLRAALRHRDLVARVGGDEFVVMATDLPGDDEAQRLGRKLLDAFAVPFSVRGQACRVGLTVGYALAPLDGDDAEGLLKRADAAMYVGKQAGKHTLRRGREPVEPAGA
ncbi:MAG: GGDEF domain-containing protein [Ideonella sp.]|nr:GGDEF domain-containing protein [Ideonella sp.]MCC7456295.1 GGDEF domain-containing protein [Nitrospira sp.]